MIKDVLVHLDGGPEDELRLAYGEVLASTWAAHLTGLFTNLVPDYAVLAPIDDGATAASVLADLEQEAVRKGDVVEQRLVDRLSRLTVAGEILRADGTPGQLASRAASVARCSDIFVASRPYGIDSSRWSGLFEAVLFESGRAMFVVPPERSPPADIQRILVCWRDTREVARAIGEALPFIARASQTSVLVVDSDPLSERQQHPVVTLVQHLKRYSNQVDVVSQDSNGRTVSEIILDRARNMSVDLIVMGGYGHSRIREWIVGGATLEMLSSSEFPILMAH